MFLHVASLIKAPQLLAKIFRKMMFYSLGAMLYVSIGGKSFNKYFHYKYLAHVFIGLSLQFELHIVKS